MAQYSRLIERQSKATDEVYALLLNYPLSRRTEGITLTQLLLDHKDRLKSDISVITALELLAEEGKVRQEKSQGHSHAYDGIRLYPQNPYKNAHGIAVLVGYRGYTPEDFKVHLCDHCCECGSATYQLLTDPSHSDLAERFGKYVQHALRRLHERGDKHPEVIELPMSAE